MPKPSPTAATPTATGITDSPQGDYALEDFGHGRRLERFGDRLLDRPAPQAQQPPRQQPWHADWVYDGPRTAAGHWSPSAESEPGWRIDVAGQTLHCRLANGGQVGIYPEHIACWNWLTALLADTPAGTPMLNLFAATGGASLAAARAGATVTHIDAQASALTLARANLAAHRVRLLREGATQFVARALRRGDHYPLIVLDPPSFGRDPKGRTWSLDRDLPPLMMQLRELLGSRPLGLWLSLHTPGWHRDALTALIDKTLPTATPHAFPLGLRSRDGRVLDGGHAVICAWPQ